MITDRYSAMKRFLLSKVFILLSQWCSILGVSVRSVRKAEFLFIHLGDYDAIIAESN